ncbi:MAG: hypothetical protein ACJ74K_09125, partial [Actinomycetes bacterium]
RRTGLAAQAVEGLAPQAAERGQDLGDLELVVQVGLEPEDVVAASAGGQRRGGGAPGRLA